MNAAKLVKVSDSIRRGINGLVGADPSAKGSTFIAQPVDGTVGLNAGIAGQQNSSVRPIAVKRTDYKDLKTGEDFRYQSKDTAAQSVKKIANDSGPRSPNPNDEGIGG
jgi:hypothetical protein